MVQNDYAYPDKKPHTGPNYYRLKMIDKDSWFSYSGIVLVRFDQVVISSMTVAPNPVRNDYSVQLKDMTPGVYYLKLFNNFGQVMQIQAATLSQSQQSVAMPPANSLPDGTYYLALYDKTGKMIKETKLIVFKN